MSSEKTPYIGLTIGPIFSTIEKIRSTRALFSASYFFSYLMRELITGLVKEGIKKEHILTPSTLETNNYPEAGYYADRLIIASKPGDFDLLLKVKSELLRKVAEKVAADLGGKEVKHIYDYLEDYLIFYAIEHELDPNDNPFGKLNQILDGLEVQLYFPAEDNNDFIEFLNLKRPTFLIKDAFKNANSFPSIIDISTKNLRQYDAEHYDKSIQQENHENKNGKSSDVNSDTNIILRLADKKGGIKNHIKNHHKYIAIVHADGDSIGKHITGLNDDTFREFSDQLFEFSKKAKIFIDEFGGRPIYIGGDDMLFLAPIAVEKEGELKTVFDLVNHIDDKFKEAFSHTKSPLSFSYGVSMTYYKYPLNEARNLSHELEAKAKRGGKNRLVACIQKGSGAAFELDFQKSDPTYLKFVQLIKEHSVDGRFLSSLIHRLGFHQETIDYLCKLPDSKKRLEYFFNNNFDEDIHKKNATYFESLNSFIRALYQVDSETYFNTLVSSLRFIHFLRSSDYEE